MLMPVISGAIGLGIVLVMGSYAYTWQEMSSEQKEKFEWRKEHQRVLDKRFEEVKRGQDKIEESINKNTDDVKRMFHEILIEQRKANESRFEGEFNKRRSR